jgi:hypothetical protein
MSPPPKTKTARRFTRATLFLAIGAALLFLAVPVSAKSNVPVCHATGSESNPYVLIRVDPAAAFHGHMGGSPQHQLGEDIIPPFQYKGVVHSQNWDAEGQALFAVCDDDDPEDTGSESDTETDTGEIPVFGSATTLGLGTVGALGGALLMLRRKL